MFGECSLDLVVFSKCLLEDCEMSVLSTSNLGHETLILDGDDCADQVQVQYAFP